MCSVFGMLNLKEEEIEDLRPKALEQSRKMLHRGPDWEGIYTGKRAILVHERLSIVDPANGAQPLYNQDGSHILAVNGEIYNHKAIEDALTGGYKFKTASDCECILALYEEKQEKFIEDLNGIFGFVLYDEKEDCFLIARDHMGIIPLYIGYDSKGHLFVSSEMKGLIGICDTVKEFPAGSYMYSKNDMEIHRYYQRDWMDYQQVESNITDINELRKGLEDAVKRQLMCDVPYGVLLSGGLDSSVISAITKRFAARRIEDDGASQAWWPQLHSFAIGLKGSPDLAKAKVVADAIGTVHHEINFTVQEGIDALRDVIYHIETYDVTTIRASTPMFLMARYIKAMGIKMVLSGEGSDELFGGYLYFHKAPNAREFHEETVRKLDQLHLYDCLRANKTLAAWGVEGRVPFLDKEFIDIAMRLNPQDKMCSGDKIEKYVVRKAFEDYLPADVVWRQKEQFSDGVGYSWIDSLRDYAEKQVSDQMFAEAGSRFPLNTPLTKEAYLYRSIFEELFPLSSAAMTVPYGKSVACSTPKAIEWDEHFKNMADPSGRAVEGVHADSYHEGHKF